MAVMIDRPHIVLVTNNSSEARVKANELMQCNEKGEDHRGGKWGFSHNVWRLKVFVDYHAVLPHHSGTNGCSLVRRVVID